MNIGYARVSTDEQNLDLQRQALEAAGCDRIIENQGTSGSARERPGLTDALGALREGDVLVVWRLDRLGRSLAHLSEIVDGIGETGAGFVSLSESIDTTTAGGRLVFHMMGALAEFERALISERTRAGMQAAKRQGRRLGRPRSLTPEQVRHARELLSSGWTQTRVAAQLGVDRKTIRRTLE